ncbi:MAG: hypothetical protein ABSF23_02620 [Terracidiphilus sp.]
MAHQQQSARIWFGRKGPRAHHLSELSPFATRESYDQKNAKGFIRILALPARTQARLLAKTK